MREPVWASSMHVQITETGSRFWETINMLPHSWETGLVPPSAFHILSEKGNFSKYFPRVMFRREVIFKFYSHSKFNEIHLQTGLQWTSKAELNESFTSVLVAAISFPYSLLMGGLGPTIAGLKIEPFKLGQQFCSLGKLVAVLGGDTWKLETWILFLVLWNFLSLSYFFNKKGTVLCQDMWCRSDGKHRVDQLHAGWHRAICIPLGQVALNSLGALF